jgi:hypothetical protein
MIVKYIAILSLLALAGCCGTGLNCTAHLPDGSVAWDGLGAAPQENTVPNDTPASMPPANRNKRQRSAQPDSRVRAGNEWEQEQISDQAADAKLTRELKICSNC